MPPNLVRVGTASMPTVSEDPLASPAAERYAPESVESPGAMREFPCGPSREFPRGPSGELPRGPSGELPRGPSGELPRGPSGELPRGPSGDFPRRLSSGSPPPELPRRLSSGSPPPELPRRVSSGSPPTIARPPSGEAAHDIVRHTGAHALVAHATIVGDATSVLPVISTLSFGFSVAGLLEQHHDERKSPLVQLLLALSAVLSLYTTTFAVLEAYYIKMLGSADVFAEYINAHYDDFAVEDDRDTLARAVNELVIESSHKRAYARNALWASVVLLLAACGVQTFHVTGVNAMTVALAVVLLAGAFAVPRTVLFFRRRYRPVLEAYHEGHAPPTARHDHLSDTPSSSAPWFHSHDHRAVMGQANLLQQRGAHPLVRELSVRWNQSMHSIHGRDAARGAHRTAL